MPDPIILFGPEYLALPRNPTPWLIRSLVPREGFTLAYAPPKQGKTTAILQLAEALSTPDTVAFFGLQIQHHGPVGFFQLDTPADLWREEYVEAMANTGLDFAQVAFHDRDTLPKGFWPFNILNPAHAAYLRAWVTALHPVAVIVDSYRACFVGEEKDSSMTYNVVSALQAALAPAALILIHHNKKPAGDAPQTDESQVEEARGSGALTAMADVLWRISRKRWGIIGRGGDARIATQFDRETGLLSPKTPINNELIYALKASGKFPSDRQIATHLADLSGLPFETCRNHLKRYVRPTTLSQSRDTSPS